MTLRRLTLALVLLACSSQAWAQPRQNIYSTKAQKEFEQALTPAGWFGVPRSTTALLPACATANKGALRFDTTLGALVICGGTTWNAPFTAAATTGALTISGQGVDATLGAELLTNGTFTGAATGWTLGLGGGAPDWAYSANTVTHGNVGGTTALEPTTPLTVVAGASYLIGFAITNYVAGTVTPSIGGASGAAVNGNTSGWNGGVWSEVIVATNTTNFKLTPTTTFDGTIDDVTVKLITQSTSAFSVTNAGATYPLETRISSSGIGSMFLGYIAGNNNTVGGSFNLGIGPQAMKGMTSGDLNVAVGTSAMLSMSTGGNNTCVGVSCLRSFRVGQNNTCMGLECLRNGTGNDNNSAFGTQAGLGATGTKNTLIGATVGSTDTGSQNTSVGYGNSASTFSYCVTLGYGADCTASNQGVIGGDDASAGITELYLGQGVVKGSPAGIVVAATGGTSSDNVGGNLTLAAGKSTGAAAPATIILQTGTAIASSATPQTLSNRVAVDTHLRLPGTAPVVSACGVSPSVVAGSDHAGKITTGTGGTVQSCTITFANAWGAAPACIANDETGILAVRATSTTTTLVIDSAVAGTLAAQVLSYICVQGS